MLAPSSGWKCTAVSIKGLKKAAFVKRLKKAASLKRLKKASPVKRQNENFLPAAFKVERGLKECHS